MPYREITRASRSAFPAGDFFRCDMAWFPFHAQKLSSGWTSRTHSWRVRSARRNVSTSRIFLRMAHVCRLSLRPSAFAPNVHASV